MSKTSTEVLQTIRKIISINSQKYLLDNTYFNPIHITDLADQVPELEQEDFDLIKTETESEEGSIISGKISAANGSLLNLGTVLLDGKSIIVKNTLLTPENIISFLGSNWPTEVNYNL